MAKIPVEKDSSGTAWWTWLLGLLALVLLVWLIWGWVGDDEEDLALDEEVAAVEDDVQEPDVTDTATAGLITDVSTIFDAENRLDLVGRQVRLSDMEVRGVPGDSVFYASPGENVSVQPDNRVILVSLDEVIPEPPPNVEGRYDVTEGQTLTIYGSIRAVEQEQPSAWGISPEEGEQMLAEAQIYVRAQRLQITETAEGSPQEAPAP